MKQTIKTLSQQNIWRYFITLMLCSQMIYAQASIETHEPQPTTLSSLFKPATILDTLFGASTANYTFHSSAGTDTINYVQLSLCNSGCSVCNSPIQTITAASATSPITINTSGVPYHINTAALTAYLKTYGGFTTSGTYNIGLYVQSTTQNCNSNTSYCAKNTDSGSTKLCMQATYSGTAVTNITQVDNGSVTLDTSINQFVYIVDQGLRQVYYCTINNTNPSTGALACTATTNQGVTSPNSISTATLSGAQYAYVTQITGSSDNIYYC